MAINESRQEPLTLTHIVNSWHTLSQTKPLLQEWPCWPSFHNNVVGSKWLCCYYFLSQRAVRAAVCVCGGCGCGGGGGGVGWGGGIGGWVVTLSARGQHSLMSECQRWCCKVKVPKVQPRPKAETVDSAPTQLNSTPPPHPVVLQNKTNPSASRGRGECWVIRGESWQRAW